MDKSKEYIEMSDCPEIQELADFNDAYSFFELNKNYMTFLPRQDQLQDMVGSFVEVQAMLRDLDDYHVYLDGRHIDIGSMEQLWLAFVMKEKFGKVWNGDKWE